MNKNIILDVTLKFVLSFISIGMAIFTLARQPYHNPPLFQRVWKILGGGGGGGGRGQTKG
jgi:hypothetical protein